MSRTGLNYVSREPEQAAPVASRAPGPPTDHGDFEFAFVDREREIDEAKEFFSSTLRLVRIDNVQHSIAELIGYPVKTQAMLEAVVDAIFCEALGNEGRQGVYATLISRIPPVAWSDKIVRVQVLANKEAPAGTGAYYDVSGGKGEWRGPFKSKEAARAEGLSVSNFRRLILNCCQDEFFREHAHKDITATEAAEREAVAARLEAEGSTFKLLVMRRLAANKEIAKTRWLSNISFIGHLYIIGLLSPKIMHGCAANLLHHGDISIPHAIDTEAIVKLMTLAGGKLEEDEKVAITKEIAAAKDKGAAPGTQQRIPLYFELMTKLSKDTKLESRLRYLLQELIDLRANNWQPSTTGRSAAASSTGGDSRGDGASISTNAQDIRTGDAVDTALPDDSDEAVNDAIDHEVEVKDAQDADESLGIRRPAAHGSTLAEFDLAAATIPLKLQLRHGQAPRTTTAHAQPEASAAAAVEHETRQPAVALAELEERLVAAHTDATTVAPLDSSRDQVVEAATEAEQAAAGQRADIDTGIGASSAPPQVSSTVTDAITHTEDGAAQAVVNVGLEADLAVSATVGSPLDFDAGWSQLLRDINAHSSSWTDLGSFASLTGNRTSAAVSLPAASLAMPLFSTALDPPEAAPAVVAAALQSELAATRLENVALRQELVSVRTGVASLNSTVEALTVQVSALAGLLHKVLDAKRALQLTFSL